MSQVTSGVLGATQGGTDQSSYSIGDILYADTTTSLARLADVAVGNALISGGLNAAPAWGKIALASAVSGTLGVANGGTGVTTSTGTGDVVLSNSPTLVTPALGTPASGNLANCTFPTLNQNTTGTAGNVTGVVAIINGGTASTTAQGAMNTLAGATTSGSYLRGNGTNVVMATIVAGDVPTLNQNTTGTAAGLSATLAVGSGGTGATTLTGILKGNGTSAFTAATAGTDYVAPGGALGTPSSGTLTNCTFPTLNQNTTGSAATFTSTSQNSQFNSIGVGTPGSGTAGEIRATNNITAYYSDARLKDFKGTIPNALEKVQALNGYYFTENAKAKELGYDNARMQVGVSAQEVEAVLPEVVTDAPINANFEGADYRTVYYDKLVPLLIEAIKELKAEVDELKKAK
jgi:hypothetical protein